MKAGRRRRARARAHGLSFLSLSLSLCALLTGCFDFGSLKPSANSDAAVDGGSRDGATEAGTPCRKLFTPTGWSELAAAEVAPCGSDLVFAAMPSPYYVILTGMPGGAAGKVVRLAAARPLKDLRVEHVSDVVAELPVNTISLGGEEAAAIIGTRIIIEPGVVILATGAPGATTDSRPLVLVASNSIEVLGTLDVGADLFLPGPGRAGPDSLDGATPGAATLWAGAGGSHGSAGGSVGTLGPGTPRAGGSVALRRGGAGGDGRRPDPAGEWIPGGAGGGVVQLVALGSVKVGASGVVSAGGGEGYTTENRTSSTPGGGGGAGGTVVMEAPSVQIFGAVGAPGGGGASEACPVLFDCSVSLPERGLATRAMGASGGNRPGGCSGGAGSDKSGAAGSISAGEYICAAGGGAGIVRIRTAPGGLTIDDEATFHPDDRGPDADLVQVREDLEATE